MDEAIVLPALEAPPVGLGEPVELPERDAPRGPLSVTGAPEPEPEPVLELVTDAAELAPVGVGNWAKRSLDWKVTQFDDEGMRATYGRDVIGPRLSGGWV